jgi:hypothetical protein
MARSATGASALPVGLLEPRGVRVELGVRACVDVEAPVRARVGEGREGMGPHALGVAKSRLILLLLPLRRGGQQRFAGLLGLLELRIVRVQIASRHSLDLELALGVRIGEVRDAVVAHALGVGERVGHPEAGRRRGGRARRPGARDARAARAPGARGGEHADGEQPPSEEGCAAERAMAPPLLVRMLRIVPHVVLLLARWMYPSSPFYEGDGFEKVSMSLLHHIRSPLARLVVNSSSPRISFICL